MNYTLEFGLISTYVYKKKIDGRTSSGYEYTLARDREKRTPLEFSWVAYDSDYSNTVDEFIEKFTSELTEHIDTHEQLVNFCKEFGFTLWDYGSFFSWFTPSKFGPIAPTLYVELGIEMPWPQLTWEEKGYPSE